MTLIINGIDFDKRCDDAKRLLHDNIEFYRCVLEFATQYKPRQIIMVLSPKSKQQLQALIAHSRLGLITPSEK